MNHILLIDASERGKPQMFSINENDSEKPMLSLKKPIRTDRVIEEWETIQRIVISLQKKTTTQASLIQKLSSYSHNHLTAGINGV